MLYNYVIYVILLIYYVNHIINTLELWGITHYYINYLYNKNINMTANFLLYAPGYIGDWQRQRWKGTLYYMQIYEILTPCLAVLKMSVDS